MKKETDAILLEQIAYYRARANEYDEWFLRQGRYDHGKLLNGQWFSEVEQVQQALDHFSPAGQVLELACGTGLWTEKLLPYATSITAVDAVAEAIAINRKRLQSDRVRYEQADIYSWQPGERYDVIFFSFWLSHVPPERFELFWSLVRSGLKPNGRVFLVDSRYEPTSTAVDHHLSGKESTTMQRRLNDGRMFEIVKVFYEPAVLASRLQELGWEAELAQTDHHFIYATVRLATQHDRKR